MVSSKRPSAHFEIEAVGDSDRIANYFGVHFEFLSSLLIGSLSRLVFILRQERISADFRNVHIEFHQHSFQKRF